MSAIKTLCNEVELLVQFPEVGLAIADSSAPIPGYLLGEINAITYIDYGRNCKPLVNFLISRLQADTPLVSIKILKLLLYLVKNGHTEMVEEVKIHEVAVKEAMSFHGPSDDLHGKSFYENIRKLSRELLTFVFSENKEVKETVTSPGLSVLTGYGSNVNSKGLPGFGFSVKSQKSVSEKISDGVTKFFEELIPAGEKIMEEEQISHLSENLPQYKPLIINKNFAEGDKVMTVSDTELTKRKLHTRQTKSKSRVYKPGKPGGGWNDSDDDDEDNPEETDNLTEDISKASSASFDCIDMNKMEMKDNISDYIEEHKIVDEFCTNKPLYELDYKDILSLCKRCSSLNCDKILTFILEKLEMNEELVQLRALILLEYLIFHDIISLEALLKIVMSPLTNLYEKAEDVPYAVKMKARKVVLIIQNLNKCSPKPVILDTFKVPTICKIQS